MYKLALDGFEKTQRKGNKDTKVCAKGLYLLSLKMVDPLDGGG